MLREPSRTFALGKDSDGESIRSLHEKQRKNHRIRTTVASLMPSGATPKGATPSKKTSGRDVPPTPLSQREQMGMGSIVVVEQESRASESISMPKRMSRQISTPVGRTSTPNEHMKASHTRVFDDIGKRAVQKAASRQKL